MADPRHLLGRNAEAAAAGWLTACGWVVLERRWRGRAGELDIVALDADGRLVAVEVKCRSSQRAGGATAAIDRRRLSRLRGSLGAYAASAGTGGRPMRIDLVSVTPLLDGRWRLARYEAIDAW
jgi:putative endonuclease